VKRLLFAVAALFTLVALAGAVGLPDLAGAQDVAAESDTITVSGVGTVESVPNEAQMSFGVETQRPTAKAAVAANGEEMRRLINALRQAGARELATQWVSVYPVSSGEDGRVTAYNASNSVTAVIGTDNAAALIDAATEAGANHVSGPGLSSSNAEELYRQALAKAVAQAKERAQVLAKATGRGLGEISVVVEGSSSSPLPYMERAAALDSASTPVVPGEQETSATVTVTFELR
jgi:uncharacterized protein YggE